MRRVARLLEIGHVQPNRILAVTFMRTAANDLVVTTVDAHGKQLMAVDADVVPGPMQGWPPFPFALTPKARQRGAVTLKVDTVRTGS
jgi:hypothetical protein